MAGASFSWTHGWALDIGYRALYMDGGEISIPLAGAVGGASRLEIGSQWEHQIRVGLRANIW
jgi:opacity protein-like surface antigen